MVIGGAAPGDSPLDLPTQQEPATAVGRPFLERRELGLVNIGAAGTVVVDGESHSLEQYDSMFIGMGAQKVSFSGEGAKFYLISALAHKSFPTRVLSVRNANTLERGDQATGNRRTIHQLVLPGLCPSANLCLGMTFLHPGNVWNTMPPHTHERRSEVYLYFGLDADARVFHFMGQPDRLRHMIVENEQAIISPPWSVHMGVGTRSYGFIWAMAGENMDYEDMNVLDICQLE
jgi:4-deoxy-L-threo-5-hexosulose-uronate ketol-isomerase